jgi:hypothetical protein
VLIRSRSVEFSVLLKCVCVSVTQMQTHVRLTKTMVLVVVTDVVLRMAASVVPTATARCCGG